MHLVVACLVWVGFALLVWVGFATLVWVGFSTLVWVGFSIFVCVGISARLADVSLGVGVLDLPLLFFPFPLIWVGVVVGYA